jgi:F-box-like
MQYQKSQPAARIDPIVSFRSRPYCIDMIFLRNPDCLLQLFLFSSDELPIYLHGPLTRQRAAQLRLEATSKSPFDKVPHEILVEILSFLDARDLEDASLVNKRFGETIAESRELMENFPLHMFDFDGPKEEFPCFSRRYREVFFTEIYYCSERLIKALHKIGTFVETVNLNDCEIENLGAVLECFPNLKDLSIIWTWKVRLATLNSCLLSKFLNYFRCFLLSQACSLRL